MCVTYKSRMAEGQPPKAQKLRERFCGSISSPNGAAVPGAFPQIPQRSADLSRPLNPTVHIIARYIHDGEPKVSQEGSV